MITVSGEQWDTISKIIYNNPNDKESWKLEPHAFTTRRDELGIWNEFATRMATITFDNEQNETMFRLKFL